LTGNYGLLVTLNPAASTPWPYGNLELVKPDSSIAASVAVSPPSLAAQACGQGLGAWLAPPVSASSNHVYLRDGDTRIRMLEPPSNAVDVTTVPGNASIVSSFSVSPDDQRIAVVVEDFSSASTIGIRLYVEDLQGGGHHLEIYSTSTPKGPEATSLVPMGWHQGELVLGVWAACTNQQVPNPKALHLVDASTAVRQVSVGDASCVPGAWPSPAGVACYASANPQVRVYDWTGKLVTTIYMQAATELSPSGDLLMLGYGGTSANTSVISIDGRTIVGFTQGQIGCLWIDDSHVLAPGAVISYPSGTVTLLAQTGICAGRFPGGL
jgi:hypothetical protein